MDFYFEIDIIRIAYFARNLAILVYFLCVVYISLVDYWPHIFPTGFGKLTTGKWVLLYG